MRSKTLIALFCLALNTFFCAVQDNPNDPLGPAYKGWPPEAVLAVSDTGGTLVTGDTLKKKCPFTLLFRQGSQTRYPSDLSARTLVFSGPDHAPDSSVQVLGDDFSFAYAFTDSGFYRVIYRMTTEGGKTGSDSFFIKAALNLAPFCSLSVSNAALVIGDTLKIRLSGFDSDGLLTRAWILANADTAWDTLSIGRDSLLKNALYATHDTGTLTLSGYVRDDNGSTALKSLPFHVSARPLPPRNIIPIVDSIRFTPSSPYLADTLRFTGFAHDVDGVIRSWSWNFGDSRSDTGKTVAHRYPSAGTYYVMLTVMDDSSATEAETLAVTIRPNLNKAPVIDSLFSFPSTVYINDTVQFRAYAHDPEGAYLSWQWNFGDTAAGIGQFASHIYRTSGTRRITLTVTDDSGAVARDSSLYVSVLPNPNPVINSFVQSKDSIFIPDSVVFTASATDSNCPILNYFFDFGDGQSASGASSFAGHRYTAAPGSGYFTVVLRVMDNDNATASDTLTLFVKPVPNKKPVIDSIRYLPSTVYLKDTVRIIGYGHDTDGTIALWQWNFGDSKTGFGDTVFHHYATSGNYAIILTATDNDTASTVDTLNLLVRPDPNKLPVIDSIRYSPASFYVNDSVWFRGYGRDTGGTVTGWEWNFGDSLAPAFTQFPVHVFRTPGTRKVRLTITDDSSATTNDSITVSVKPNPKPVISFFSATPDSFFVPDTHRVVNFFSSATDSNGPIIDYYFDFGDGTYQNGISPNASHTYVIPDTTAGTIRAILRVMDNDSATASDTLFLHKL